MKRILSLITFLVFIHSASATHNRAGEITFRYISGRTYEVTITTYTRASVTADRCRLDLFWGDGSSSKLNRVNGPQVSCEGTITGNGVVLGNDVQKNIYIGRHTYTADGFYTLYFEDANRNAGVNNIAQSVNVPFYVQSQLVIDAGLGPNNSPVLLKPPIDDGCINKRFEHNPVAFDIDGDSLSYTLVPCRTTGGTIIPTTYDPNLVQDSVKINEATGELYWDVPKNIGQFNFAMEIAEWRHTGGGWVKIGYVVRDLQVDIENCGNNPPVIQPVGPFCVEAGTNLNFEITATDVDGDPVTLSAFGGPFEVTNPADSFLAVTGNPVTGTFNWDTECNHVRQQPYTVTFEARDNPPLLPIPNPPQPTPLVDVYTTEIQVVAPAPKNPVAVGGEGRIDLSWDESICKEAMSYDIYRREDSYGFVPSQCETGVPAYTGYTLLDSTIGLNSTSYVDTIDLQRGIRYCYMVVAIFPDRVESYASVEFCTAVQLSAPLVTNVDVLSTDPANGEIEVKWIYPPEIDSVNFPPPYSFILHRADGIEGSNFTAIQNLSGPSDTIYTDTALNTQDQGYTYKVEMLSGTPAFTLGESDPASSVFLEVTGSDERNILRATHQTPWRNNEYVIFRESSLGTFDSIGHSFVPTFVDSNLANGQEYCYKVMTIGAYTASQDLPQPLLNNSQEACGTAIDTTKPCAPLFTASYDCLTDSIYIEFDYPTDSACINDVTAYNIYFKNQETDPWPSLPLATVSSGNSIYLTGEPITGCWAITATDDAGNDPGGQPNESDFSRILCIQSCPDIVFPNVFTPNGDGSNDRFLPVSLNDIGQIDIRIFNRWGTEVFSSTNVEDFSTNGWDGSDKNSGEPCSDGVYFYLCRFTPLNFQEPVMQEMNGFIHLFRGR